MPHAVAWPVQNEWGLMQCVRWMPLIDGADLWPAVLCKQPDDASLWLAEWLRPSKLLAAVLRLLCTQPKGCL